MQSERLRYLGIDPLAMPDLSTVAQAFDALPNCAVSIPTMSGASAKNLGILPSKWICHGWM